MCRHLVGLGPSRTLAELLIDPYGLYPPSWAPRRQRHGTVTADGNLPDLARSIHNGAVEDSTWLPHDTGTLQTADELLGLGACCGSALLWALVHSRIAARGGDTLGCRATADHVVVTSEPVNDADDWQDVPDRSLLAREPHRRGIAPRRPGRANRPAQGSEYHPTRAEREILIRRAGKIARLTRARTLVELGSGASEKTRLLPNAHPAPVGRGVPGTPGDPRATAASGRGPSACSVNRSSPQACCSLSSSSIPCGGPTSRPTVRPTAWETGCARSRHRTGRGGNPAHWTLRAASASSTSPPWTWMR